MAIVAGDIDFHLSGVGGTPATSLGGAIHATQITDASLHNLFDEVSSAEAAAGDTEYRCFYVKNAHATLALQNASVWIQTDAAPGDQDIEIALGTSAVNGTEQTVADESTAPTGVTWETLTGEANELAIGDIPAGQHKAIWVKRVITLGAAAASGTSTVLRVNGDTAG